MQKLKQLANHRCVGITLDNNISVLSVYLPSRSGCTDNFKESLDMLQVIKGKLDPSGIVIFAGDLNADPGTHGGPLSTTPVNEQGHFLARYIQSLGFTSAHLHLSDTPSSHTFENPASQLLVISSVLLVTFRTSLPAMLFMTIPQTPQTTAPLWQKWRKISYFVTT